MSPIFNEIFRCLSCPKPSEMLWKSPDELASGISGLIVCVSFRTPRVTTGPEKQSEWQKCTGTRTATSQLPGPRMERQVASHRGNFSMLNRAESMRHGATSRINPTIATTQNCGAETSKPVPYVNERG